MIDNPDATHRIAVIGLGNVLLGDDGFGPTVVELLRSGWQMPANVELIDAGTPGLDLADYLHGLDEVILVDAVAADLPPGEIRLYGGDELKNLPLKPRVSPHDPALQEALWIADLAGDGPRAVVLIGAKPSSSEPGVGLTSKMFGAAGEAVQMVVDRLEVLGCALEARSEEADRAWWLRATHDTTAAPG